MSDNTPRRNTNNNQASKDKKRKEPRPPAEPTPAEFWKIAPKAAPTDGLLDIQIQHPTRAEAIALLPKVYRGDHVPHHDILEAKKNGQLGVIFGVQNSSWIEQERERIRILYKLGLRTLQLTYMERNWVVSLWLKDAQWRVLDTFDAITPAIATTHSSGACAASRSRVGIAW